MNPTQPNPTNVVVHTSIIITAICANWTGSRSKKNEKICLIFKIKTFPNKIKPHMISTIIFVYTMFVSILYRCVREVKHAHAHTRVKLSWAGYGAGVSFWVSLTNRKGEREKRQRGFVAKSRWVM